MPLSVMRWIVFGAAWVAAVTVGFGVLYRYKAEAGPATAAPASWPAESRLARAGDRPTLLMFVHPHCSCSRASLAELGRLLQRAGDRVAARIVMIRPRGVAAGWESTDLRDRATSIPGATVVVDDEGREAHRFGASTSGACVLYDRLGQLRFAGGVTALRGHEGPSFGQERLAALLAGGTADRPDSPVFGCGLDDVEASRPLQEKR